MSPAARAERRAQAAAMVAAGMRHPDVAKLMGTTDKWVRRACCEHAAVRPEMPFARNVHDSMDAPEWAGICLYRRATAEACRKPATWCAGDWHQTESQAVACDEHREAMHCRRASIKTLEQIMDEAEQEAGDPANWWKKKKGGSDGQ